MVQTIRVHFSVSTWGRSEAHQNFFFKFLLNDGLDNCPAHHLKEICRYGSHAHSLLRAVDTGKSAAKRLDRGGAFAEIPPYCSVAK